MKNNYLKKLKEILSFEIQDIESNKNKLDEVTVRLEILKELNNSIKSATIDDVGKLLNCIILQLDTIIPTKNIYRNELYRVITISKNYQGNPLFIEEYNDAINSLNKIKDSLLELEFKLEVEKEKLENKCDIEKIKKYRRIIYSLKYGQHISLNQFNVISNFFDECKMDDKEAIIMFECIKMHNTDVRENYSQNCLFDKKNKYDVIKMLNMGYEKFNNIVINPNIQSKINVEVSTIIATYEDYCNMSDKPNIQNLFSGYGVGYNNLELHAFYHTLMNKIQDNLFDQIEAIKDKEFYLDRESKNTILKEYKNLLELYKQTRIYFDNIIDKNNDQIIKENLDLSTKPITEEKINNLLFLKKSNNLSYFEKDLESIPQEYLETVIHLLDAKKFDRLSIDENKSLTGNKRYKGLLELRKGQIRIVYKHKMDNNYLIFGVSVKKDDVDYTIYDTMLQREKNAGFDIDNYYVGQDETYDRIIDYCIKNKRKKVR